jgi:hypothetical protein
VHDDDATADVVAVVVVRLARKVSTLFARRLSGQSGGTSGSTFKNVRFTLALHSAITGRRPPDSELYGLKCIKCHWAASPVKPFGIQAAQAEEVVEDALLLEAFGASVKPVVID